MIAERSNRRKGDAYDRMTTLLAELPEDGNYVLHAEESHQSCVKLFAPHGGCIEPGTDQLVVALAAAEFDYFLFRGRRKEKCYRTLHVTSARYDEPNCLRMVGEAMLAVSVHGCDSRNEFIEIGGSHVSAARDLRAHLSRAGYAAVFPADGRRGEQADNFVNRARGGGIQLELSTGFRATLFPGFPRTDQRHPTTFREFVTCVRAWLLETKERIDHGLSTHESV